MTKAEILDAIRAKLLRVGHHDGVFFPGHLMTHGVQQIATIRAALKDAGYAEPTEEGGTCAWRLTDAGRAWLEDGR